MPRSLLYILIFFCATPTILAQTASIDSDFERLINRLCDTYKVKIGYSAELKSIKVPEWSNSDMSDKSITELLDFYFSQEGLSYRMVDDDKILLRQDLIQSYKESTKLVKGKIIDGESGYSLPYASIFIDGLTGGTMSDEDGRFSIEVLKEGGQELIISYLGFKSRRLNCDLLGMNENIKLIASEEILEEVTIIVDPMVIIDIGKNNRISLDKNRLVEVNAGEVYGSDILRSIQMLPGVSNDADAAGEIQLRGSDAEETLVMLDGIPLYKTDHYYGIFGAINPYYIEEATLYKNKIPLEYENRAGGMLMLNSTNEITKTKGNVELDFLKANAYVELPLSSSIGLLLGGRFNHTDPFNSPLSSNEGNTDLDDALLDDERFQSRKLINVQPEFKFRDFNAKFKFTPSPKFSLSFATYTSSDQYDRNYDIRYEAVNKDGKDIMIEENSNNTEKWRNEGINLSGSYNFKPNKSLNWSFFNSSYENDYNIEASLSRVLRIGEVEFYNYKNVNINNISTGGVRLQYEVDDNWHIGMNLQNRRNEISIIENSKNPVNRMQEFGEGALFGKKSFFPVEGLEIGLGARMNILEAFDTLTLSPLIELKYSPSSLLYFKGSYAKLYQNFRELTFENRLGGYQQYYVLAQEGLYPLGFSNLYMLGGGFSIGALRLDVELFRKDLGGTISLLPVNPGFQGGVAPNSNVKLKLFAGKSQSRGIDIFLGYDTPSIFSQLAYTYSKTEDIFQGINRAEPFPSQNDRRHQLKWLNAFTVGDLMISASSVYSSGRPYISFDLLSELGNTRNRFEEALVNLPYYLRLDVGLRYNLLNRQNVKFIQQTFSIPVDTGSEDEVIIGSESGLVDRLFNITLGVNF